jgi:hypothetical protein
MPVSAFSGEFELAFAKNIMQMQYTNHRSLRVDHWKYSDLVLLHEIQGVVCRNSNSESFGIQGHHFGDLAGHIKGVRGNEVADVTIGEDAPKMACPVKKIGRASCRERVS